MVRSRWSGGHLVPPEQSPALTHSTTCHNNLQIKNLPSSTSNTGMPSFFLDSGDSRKKPYSNAYSTAYSSFVSPTQSNIRSSFILHVLLIPPLQIIICQRRIANKFSFFAYINSCISKVVTITCILSKTTRKCVGHTCTLHNINLTFNFSSHYMYVLQVNFLTYSRLILVFLCLVALISHELGLQGEGREST